MRSSADIRKAIDAAEAELAANVGQHIDRQDFALQSVLQTAIKALYVERDAAAARETRDRLGLPNPETKAAAHVPAVLRMPRRMTKALADGAVRGVIDYKTVTGYEKPSENYAKTFSEIVNAAQDQKELSLARVEDSIWDVVQQLRDSGHDRQRAFTDSLYVAFVGVLTELAAGIDAARVAGRLQCVELAAKLSAGLNRKADDASTTIALVQRIAALEQALSENPPIQYHGVWSEGTYEKNALVSSQGSAFIAKRRTTSKPGIALPDGVEADWQMMVKRGRDGKDLR